MHTEKELQASQEWSNNFFDRKFKFNLDGELNIFDLESAHLAGQTYAKENAWIMVDSGKLPEKDGDYLGTIKWYGGSYTAPICYHKDYAGLSLGHSVEFKYEIIAWMHYPDPYILTK